MTTLAQISDLPTVPDAQITNADMVEILNQFGGAATSRRMPLSQLRNFVGAGAAGGTYLIGAAPYLADNTGVTLCSAIVANAIADAVAAGGGTVEFPAGAFKCAFAVPPNVHIRTAGKGVTIFVQPVADTPVITASGVPYRTQLTGGFSVKPHTGTTTGALIDIAGFTFLNLEDPDYLDNGAGTVDALITLSAWRGGVFRPCYFNNIVRPTAKSSTTMKRLIRFENDGTASSANNANAIFIYSPGLYACNGVVCAIDALRSASVTIFTPSIESCPGGIALIPGTDTIVYGGWTESNIVNEEISFQVAVDGASNGFVAFGFYMMSPGTITVPNTLSTPPRFEHCPNSKTFADSTGGVIRVEGNTTTGTAADFRRIVKNTAAGGVTWHEIEGATGGAYGAGSRALYDATNAKIRQVVHALAQWRLLAGASASSALDVIPFDDTTPGQPLQRWMNAAESVVKAYLTKAGGFVATALTHAAQTIVYAASMGIDASVGNTAVITATNGTAFTITGVSNGVAGQWLTVRIRNASGGALGAVTWGAGFKMAAWASPATGFSRSITFDYDGTNWVERTRTPADVPN